MKDKVYITVFEPRTVVLTRDQIEDIVVDSCEAWGGDDEHLVYTRELLDRAQNLGFVTLTAEYKLDDAYESTSHKELLEDV